MEEKTINDIKESIGKQRKSLEYIYNFLEEINNITDENVLLHIATIVRLKHQELLKEKQSAQTTIRQPVMQPQSAQEIFRAKDHNEI